MIDSLFPYFGGKSRVADAVWERFGKIGHFIEPFFGSGAVLFAAPHTTKTITINDLDGYVCNFWRAIKAASNAVVEHAKWPVNEIDLHARNAYVVRKREGFTDWLKVDPDRYDAKIAGWWCWGMSSAIGSSWATGNGCWGVNSDRDWGKIGKGGVKDGMPHLSNKGMGVNRPSGGVARLMAAKAERLASARICCGDFERILGKSVLRKGNGKPTGIFLDPPYADDRAMGVYAEDSHSVSQRVAKWCQEHQGDLSLRIALCGYEGHYDLPGWRILPWKANGGYGSRAQGRGRENASREVVFFSPGCLSVGLFDQ